VLSYRQSAFIRRQPAEVARFCSDLQNELLWNPDAISVEKLTAGPIGVGTRYRAQWRKTKPTVVDVVEFEPGRRWVTESRAMGMEIQSIGKVEAAPDGTRFTAHLSVKGKGLGRLAAPFAMRMMRREDVRNMCLIREELEGTRVAMAPPEKGRPAWQDLPPKAKAFRIAHVLAGIVNLTALGYVWLSAVRRRRDSALVASVSVLAAEGLALVVGHGNCPFGSFQRSLGDPVPMFELFLPPRAAKAAIPVLTVVVLAAFLAVLMRPPRQPNPSSPSAA